MDPSSSPDSKKSKPHASLIGLVEGWWGEAKTAGRTLSTYESYASTARRLAAFLKHDDAAAVTPADIVAFKDYRLAQGVGPKTVGDSDIAGLRSVFDWAVANLKLPSNPAKAVKVTRPKKVKVRDDGLSPEEATAILSHSLGRKQGGDKPKTFAAKRWVPWLCAYTGARVGEMVQLRKQDLRREGDLVGAHDPSRGQHGEGQRGPQGSASRPPYRTRLSHLRHQGCGRLFIPHAAQKGRLVRGVWRAVKNRVTEFVREVVTDPNVAPNHGWRHAFKTVGREVGIEDSVLDGICGHAANIVGGSYGVVSLKAQAEAMVKFPRYATTPADS